jgi:oligopeptide transport system substrate-binding protein
MSKDHIQRILRFTTLAICLISLVASVTLGLLYQRDKQKRRELAFSYGQQAAARTQQVVNNEMQIQMDVATRLADDLTSGALAYADLAGRMRQDLEEHPILFGLGVAFEPYTYKPDLRLYAPYYRKDELGQYTRVQTENFYDYTDRSDPDSSFWYYDTIEQGAHWYLSGFDPAAQAILVEYYVPFYHTDPQSGKQIPAGMIYIDHSLDTIKSIVQSVDIGQEGYNVLVSDEGYIVVHPQASLMNKTTAEVASLIGDAQFDTDVQRAQHGEDFYRERTATLGGKSWTFYKPLQNPGWIIATVMQQNAFAASPQTTLRIMTWLGVVVMIFLLSLFGLVFRIERGDEKRLWAASLWALVVLFGGLIWIWGAVNKNPIQNQNATILTNNANTENIIRKVEADLENYGVEPPLRIRTGINIESMSIQANEATFSGYVWQKYPIGQSDEITQGVQFPDDLSEASQEEVYRFQKNGYEVVGWFFIATLKQSFHIEGYPLDQVNAGIRLLPKVLSQNIILVPDFDEYDFTAPSRNPGLSQNLELADFKLERSYFGYQFDTYNSGMGGAAQVKRNLIPALTFNISASRNILSPIIAFCITVVVVSGLMFGSILVKLDSAFSALSNAAALFFVIAITHVGLRSTINASGVVYLEYLFIILYVFILGLAVNGMMVYSDHPPALVAYKNNLIAKLTFVPLLMASFVVVTMVAFYPMQAGDDRLSTLAALTNEDAAPTELTAPEPSTTPEVVVSATPAAVSANVPAVTPIAIPITDDTVTLRYIIGADPSTIDPSLSSTVFDSNQIGNLFMGLTRLEAETNLVQPSLALTWTVSADGLTWTFQMRHDVPWVQYDAQNGTARPATDLNGQIRYVNAQDVVYGIRRTLTSKNGAAVTLFPILNAAEVNQGNADPSTLGVKAVDDWTVQFTLKEPAPYFAQLLAYEVSYPVPQWVIDEWGDEWTRLDNLQTNGPYLLATWENAKQITLLKNPFWPLADGVQIEQVVQIISDNAEKTLALYRSNQADGASSIGSEIIQTAQSDLVLSKELVFAPELCTRYFGFVNTKPPFDDARLRRAFSAAIDRQAIADSRQRGNLIAAVFAPPGVFGAVHDPSAGLGYNPELAKQLFQQYLTERGLTLADFNSAYPLVLGQVDILDNSPADIALQNWQEILGVSVITETVARADFYTRIAKDAPIEDAFNLFQWGWCADYPDQNNFVYTLFNAEAGINQVRRNCADATCQAANPGNEFDQLTAEAGQTTDPAKRQELYSQAEHLLVYEEAAVAPLYYGSSAYLSKTWLTRNYPNMGAPDYWNWRIDTEKQK